MAAKKGKRKPRFRVGQRVIILYRRVPGPHCQSIGAQAMSAAGERLDIRREEICGAGKHGKPAACICGALREAQVEALEEARRMPQPNFTNDSFIRALISELRGDK